MQTAGLETYLLGSYGQAMQLMGSPAQDEVSFDQQIKQAQDFQPLYSYASIIQNSQKQLLTIEQNRQSDNQNQGDLNSQQLYEKLGKIKKKYNLLKVETQAGDLIISYLRQKNDHLTNRISQLQAAKILNQNMNPNQIQEQNLFNQLSQQTDNLSDNNQYDKPREKNEEVFNQFLQTFNPEELKKIIRTNSSDTQTQRSESQQSNTVSNSTHRTFNLKEFRKKAYTHTQNTKKTCKKSCEPEVSSSGIIERKSFKIYKM